MPITARPRKYSPGTAFETLAEFIAHVQKGGWVFIIGRTGPIHPGWAGTTGVGRANDLIIRRRILRANRDESFAYVFKAWSHPGYPSDRHDTWFATCDELRGDKASANGKTLCALVKDARKQIPAGAKLKVEFTIHPEMPEAR